MNIFSTRKMKGKFGKISQNEKSSERKEETWSDEEILSDDSDMDDALMTSTQLYNDLCEEQSEEVIIKETQGERDRVTETQPIQSQEEKVYKRREEEEERMSEEEKESEEERMSEEEKEREEEREEEKEKEEGREEERRGRKRGRKSLGKKMVKETETIKFMKLFEEVDIQKEEFDYEYFENKR